MIKWGELQATEISMVRGAAQVKTLIGTFLKKYLASTEAPHLGKLELPIDFKLCMVIPIVEGVATLKSLPEYPYVYFKHVDFLLF